MTILVLLGGSTMASPFARRFQYAQPNGVQITLWGQGDDFGAVFETLDGYTVVFAPERRAYYYARVSLDRQSLEATEAMVGRDSPVSLGLPTHLRIDPRAAARAALQRRQIWDVTMNQTERWSALKARNLGMGPRKHAPPNFQTLGVKCGLTILIDFEDERGTFTREEISEFLNGDHYTQSGNNGSVKQYFADVSGGRLTFTNVVTPYITISNSVHPRSYYNDPTKNGFQQCQYLIRDALNAMKKLPNFTNDFLPLFEAATSDSQRYVVSANFFVAGANSGVWLKGIWGQTSALSYYVGQQTLTPLKIVNLYQLTPMEGELDIMVFCHENGHLLCGFPDIYDYDVDSVSGAGPLCLMAGGQAWSKNPSQVCAYLKTAAGWADVVDLPVGTNFLATLSSAGNDFNHFFRLRKPGASTEYFLLENRQKAGRDAEIPSSGIVVWHVDELGDRDNQSLRTNTTHLNYEITLEQADNRWDLQYGGNAGDAEDLFYQGNPAPGYQNTFSDLTSPSAHWWNGVRSGLTLSEFSTNAETMTFRIAVGSVTIRTDPADQTVVQGASVAMRFYASLPADFVTIRWHKDGAPLADSERVTGVTNNTLRISSAELSDAGRYSAVVAYSSWTNWTREAQITVLASPPFTNSAGAGTTTLQPDGAELTAPATSFGATWDTYRFAYSQLGGDFDVRVQLRGISMQSLQTRAGLMARASLSGSAAYIAGLNGMIPEGQRSGVQARFATGSPYKDLLSYLSPYDWEPWLRMKREGNRFTCYRSDNITNWVWLSSVECDLGDAPYVGLVLASAGDSSSTASALFRKYQVATSSVPTVAIFGSDACALEGSLRDAAVAVHSSRNGPLTVKLSFDEPARNGVDYAAEDEVVIPAGTNVGFVSMRAINDSVPGLPRRVGVSLPPQPGIETVLPTNAAVLILDDDQLEGGLARRTFKDIGGVAVAELARQMTNNAAQTDVGWLTSFEVAPDTNTFGFGEVLSGYLVPPETGDYVFYLASAHNSELWLSLDETPANLRRVAVVAGYTDFRFYTGSGNHSQPIRMEQGKPYCVKALHKNAGGFTSFSVAWRLPGGLVPTNGAPPIDGQFLRFALPCAPAVQLSVNGLCADLACQTSGAQTCVLEVSHDLFQWSPVWTNSLPARLDLLNVDPASATRPTQFYRAVMK